MVNAVNPVNPKRQGPKALNSERTPEKRRSGAGNGRTFALVESGPDMQADGVGEKEKSGRQGRKFSRLLRQCRQDGRWTGAEKENSATAQGKFSYSKATAGRKGQAFFLPKRGRNLRKLEVQRHPPTEGISKSKHSADRAEPDGLP